MLANEKKAVREERGQILTITKFKIMSKLIKVRITAEQVVQYNQDIEMTQEDYDTLYNLNDTDVSEMRQTSTYRIVESSIDVCDVFSAENEFLNVNVQKLTTE